MALVYRSLVNGSLLDISGNEYDGTLTVGSGGFKKTERGLAMLFDGTTTKVSVGDIPALDFTSDFSISMWVKNREHQVQYFLDKSSYNVKGYSVEEDGTGILFVRTLWDGGGSKTFFAAAELGVWTHYVFTYEAATLTCRTYTNGVLSNEDVASNLLVAAAGRSLVVGAAISGYKANAFMQDVRLYDHKMILPELVRNYNMELNYGGFREPKRSFYYSAPSDLSKEPDIVSGWNMALSGGDVLDIGGNSNDGVATDCLDAKGMRGRSVLFNGASSQINMGNVSAMNPGRDDFSVVVIFKPLVIGNQVLLSKSSASGESSSNAGWKFQITTAGKLEFFFSDGLGISVTRVTGDSVLRANEWYVGVATLDRNGNGTVYVNGLVDKVTDISGFSGLISNTSNVYFGRRTYAPSPAWFQGFIDEGRYYNGLLSSNHIAKITNELMNQVGIRETFGDAGADGVSQLPRGWYLDNSGELIVGELSAPDGVLDRGQRYIQWSAGGSFAIPSRHSYSTWEFDYRLGDGNNSDIRFISDRSANNAANCYKLYFNPANPATLFLGKETGGGTTSLGTSLIMVDVGEWYRYKITCQLVDGDNLFKVYLNGVKVIEVSDSSYYGIVKYFSFSATGTDRLTNLLVLEGVAA